MLNIKRENLGKSKVKLLISIPPEMMRRYFDKVYNKLALQIEVKGFRPGKAPRNLTIMQIGENRITSEVIDSALKESYPQALNQEKLIPVSPPKINILKIVDLIGDTAEIEYEAELELLPEVRIGKYKELRIKKQAPDNKASKDETNQVLSHLQRQHAQFKDIEHPAKKGDRVEIDFEGKDKGVILEHLSSKNYPVILGSKVLLPEFEKEIIGLKKDEEKTFSMNIGKEKSAQDGSASGRKKVDFKVKVNQVQEVILPELNNDLAKKFQKNSLKELTQAISEDIIKQKDLTTKQNQENQLIEELLKISEVEVPEGLIEQEVRRTVERLKERVKVSGATFEQYLSSIKKTEEELKNDLKPQAEKTIKIGLILGEIGKKESANWRIDISKEGSGKQVIEKLLILNTKRGAESGNGGNKK